MQTFKSTLSHPIHLEPIEIDIDFSNKMPFNINPFQAHLRTTPILSVIRKYDDILNSSIEEVIECLSESSKIKVTLISDLANINKTNISFNSILTLRTIPKLTYLLHKCSSPLDEEVLRKEIEYWKSFLLYTITDSKYEETVYDSFDRKRRRNELICKNKEVELFFENSHKIITLTEDNNNLEHPEIILLNNRQAEKKSKSSTNLKIYSIL